MSLTAEKHGLVLFVKKFECTTYCPSVSNVRTNRDDMRTSRLRFLRYFRLKLRYAFHTQFQPGVCRLPAARNTTV